MSRRVLASSLTALAFALCGQAVQAQSYQSSFSGVSFDRAKTPASFTGGVTVDAPSGAASVDIPLGPGIGRGALRFQPTLSGRFNPRVNAVVNRPGLYDMPPFIQGDFPTEAVMAEIVAANMATGEMTTTSAGGASLSPGYFDLLCSNAGNGTFVSNFQAPDGSRGSLVGTVPSAVNTATILGEFGYGSGTQISRMPGKASVSNPPTFLAVGSNDELVLGLVDAAFPLVSVNDFHDPMSPVEWRLPRRILVVRGDVAFEYLYVNPVYAVTWVPLPRVHNDPNGGKTYDDLRFGHYLINRMLNRFGESLEFDHNQGNLPQCNGIDYTVKWKSGGSVLETLSVTKMSSTSITPSPVVVLMDSRLSQGGNTKVIIEVSYPGTGQSSYQVEAYPAEGGISLIRHPDDPTYGSLDAWYARQHSPWDAFRMNLQPTKVTEMDTGATVNFRYGAGLNLGPIMTYVDPMSGANATHAPTVLLGVDFPSRTVDLTWDKYPYRENQMTDEYEGFQPTGLLGKPSSFAGVSKIRDQDTSSGIVRETTHTRVVPEPDFNGYGWTSTAFYDAIKHPDGSTSLHLFTPPVQPTGLGPVGGPSDSPENQIQTLGFLKHSIRETRHYPQGAGWDAGPSVDSAHTVETFDRWDLRRAGNPNGNIMAGSVPYPTRTQVWSRDTGAMLRQERISWDGAQLGWSGEVQRIYSAGPPASLSWRSLAATGSGSDAPMGSFNRDVTRSLSSDLTKWFLGRVTFERVNGKPPAATEFNSNNTVKEVTVGENGSTVKTSFTYSGQLPQTVTLSGTDGGMALGGSGSVGIAQYGYDSHGFLTSIRQAGVGYSSCQVNDGFGRPTNQTDPNGLSVNTPRDGVGRVMEIAPLFGDYATSIAYDSDQRGSTVARGQELSAHRYNGFGELVLTSRYDGGAWSHKRFDYDAGGRKSVETVWLPGKGSESEPAAGASGTHWGYDDRGRLRSVVDPNGVVMSVSYSGLVRTTTVAPDTPDMKVTTFTSDAAGRLVEVRDAKNQVTSYGYDTADRIENVTHPGSGQPSREWHYNGLGWLTSLVQPESGTTSYSEFHVTGKPGRTIYADGSILSTGYDSLGRPTGVSGSGVSQNFGYDQPGHGLANGKLTSSSDQGVSLSWSYGNAGGRLSDLVTSIAKSNGVSGSIDYSQSFTYDAYGRRGSAITDGRKAETGYAEPTGQPSSVTYSGAGMINRTLASITQFDADSWMPKGISYAATGASSLLTYRPDQTSLWSMAHYVDGAPSPKRQWNYQYDFAGRLKGDGEDSYFYDELDRLKTATVKRKDNTTVGQTFEYDAFGNQVSSVSTPVPSDLVGLLNNFTFNAAEKSLMAATNRIPPSANGVPTGAQYDGRGNLTRIYAQAASTNQKIITLTYDLLGRVLTLTRPGGWVESYSYTPDGLRARIELRQNSVLKTVKHRLYNDQRQLVSEYEGRFAP